MISPKSFLYEVSDAQVATITLNRPERLNALTFEVYRELTDAFAALQDEPGVRAVVITGAGRAFCSGGDVRDIIADLLPLDIHEHLEFTRLTCDLIRRMRQLRKPVIASLNGTAAGAGAVIALAAEEARIAFLFVRVGLSGADMGAAYLLPRCVGLAKATELLYTGDFLSAREAERIGLYNRVVAGAELETETRALAERLARGPSFALGMTKEMLNRELHVDLDTALEWEAQAQSVCMQHPDFREAHEAINAKREPVFKK
jgi:enoyl-CoA hydratase/carnithine racemase